MDQERYELVDVIGSGGMATVWRARDARLGRLVAIKRPHPAPPGSTSLVRFAREARAAARVSHRHLVSVYDSGEDSTGPYLVMEYVDGPPLAAATVPSQDVARLGAQLASALAELHAAGIVHGDVKPGNILMSPIGAKLTDFGIARTVEDTSTLTLEGMALGTPAYAAPETLVTGERSAAGDVYSLAAVLHELLTGRRWSAVDATQAVPGGGWAAVLGPALSSEPSNRPSAVELGEAIDRLDRAAVADQATTVLPRSVPPVATDDDDHRRNRRAAGLFLVMSLVAAIVVVGIVAVAGRGDDDTATAGGTDPQPAVSSVPDSGSPAPTAVEVAVDEPPATTTPTSAAPSTVPATTVPPSTVPPSTSPPELSPAVAVAGDLVDLFESMVPDEMSGEHAADLVGLVAGALQAANGGDRGEAASNLRGAIRWVDDNVDDRRSRNEALTQLVAMAIALGIDPADVIDDPRFDDRRGGDDD